MDAWPIDPMPLDEPAGRWETTEWWRWYSQHTLAERRRA